MPRQQTLTQAEQAALNNAHWCDMVCRTHGVGGSFHDALWLTQQQTPRFYPNAVTLAQAGSERQLAAIHGLISTTPLAGLAVKDSFCTLDLAPFNFRMLFEASWLWRSELLPKPNVTGNSIHWAIVQDSTELARWEEAWNGPPDDIQSTLPRVFLPALLDDPDIRFVAAYQHERIVGGAIANRSERVVGISNVFASAATLSDIWAGSVATAIDAFPGLALVGYEHGTDLAIAQSLGFEDVGPLRIWAWERPNHSSPKG